MTHYLEICDTRGDLVELIPFCSDACHREWCRSKGFEYEGWNGAHDGPDYNEYCRNCGVITSCGDESCVHQQDNFIVNRFTTETGQQCECGHWIQLPRHMLDN